MWQYVCLYEIILQILYFIFTFSLYLKYVTCQMLLKLWFIYQIVIVFLQFK